MRTQNQNLKKKSNKYIRTLLPGCSEKELLRCYHFHKKVLVLLTALLEKTSKCFLIFANWVAKENHKHDVTANL